MGRQIDSRIFRRKSRRMIALADQIRQFLLFDSNSLGQASRAINVATADNCNVVGQQLQWDYVQDWLQTFNRSWNPDEVIGHETRQRIMLIHNSNNRSGACSNFLYVAQHFPVLLTGRRHGNGWRVETRQHRRTMF